MQLDGGENLSTIESINKKMKTIMDTNTNNFSEGKLCYFEIIFITLFVNSMEIFR